MEKPDAWLASCVSHSGSPATSPEPAMHMSIQLWRTVSTDSMRKLEAGGSTMMRQWSGLSIARRSSLDVVGVHTSPSPLHPHRTRRE